MIRIRWTPAAAQDLGEIAAYLREHRPEFERSTVLRLYESVRSLKVSPNRGRSGREAGTRELVCAPLPYIVAYRLKHDVIEILRIQHGARLH